MLFSNPAIVQDALNLVGNDGNGWLTLTHQTPQTNWITNGGRTYADERDPTRTHSRIPGYSHYEGSNAGGSFERIVAHGVASHVMTVIKARVDLDVSSIKATDTDTLVKFYKDGEISTAGGIVSMVEMMLMARKYGPQAVNSSFSLQAFLDVHGDMVDGWLDTVPVALVPILSDAHAHEMMNQIVIQPYRVAADAVYDEHGKLVAEAVTAQQEIKASIEDSVAENPQLSKTVWFVNEQAK